MFKFRLVQNGNGDTQHRHDNTNHQAATDAEVQKRRRIAKTRVTKELGSFGVFPAFSAN